MEEFFVDGKKFSSDEKASILLSNSDRYIFGTNLCNPELLMVIEKSEFLDFALKANHIVAQVIQRHFNR